MAFVVVVVRWLSRVDKLWFQHNCRTHLPFSVAAECFCNSEYEVLGLGTQKPEVQCSSIFQRYLNCPKSIRIEDS